MPPRPGLSAHRLSEADLAAWPSLEMLKQPVTFLNHSKVTWSVWQRWSQFEASEPEELPEPERCTVFFVIYERLLRVIQAEKSLLSPSLLEAWDVS